MPLICFPFVHTTRVARAILTECTEPPPPSCALPLDDLDQWLSRNIGCYQSIVGYIRTKTSPSPSLTAIALSLFNIVAPYLSHLINLVHQILSALPVENHHEVVAPAVCVPLVKLEL